jgi:small-conductance mechanosensitive channel
VIPEARTVSGITRACLGSLGCARPWRSIIALSLAVAAAVVSVSYGQKFPSWTTIVLVGSIATLIITLALLKVPVGQLVLGGAVTTILIGIAAQQSLSNVFAGIVLLLSRPFGVGDAVRFQSGALSGQIEGIVTEVGITYVRIDTGDGVLHLPNSQALAAAVGPARQPAEDPARPAAGVPPQA